MQIRPLRIKYLFGLTRLTVQVYMEILTLAMKNFWLNYHPRTLQVVVMLVQTNNLFCVALIHILQITTVSWVSAHLRLTYYLEYSCYTSLGKPDMLQA